MKTSGGPQRLKEVQVPTSAILFAMLSGVSAATSTTAETYAQVPAASGFVVVVMVDSVESSERTRMAIFEPLCSSANRDVEVDTPPLLMLSSRRE